MNANSKAVFTLKSYVYVPCLCLQMHRLYLCLHIQNCVYIYTRKYCLFIYKGKNCAYDWTSKCCCFLFAICLLKACILFLHMQNLFKSLFSFSTHTQYVATSMSIHRCMQRSCLYLHIQSLCLSYSYTVAVTVHTYSGGVYDYTYRC